MKRFLIFLLPFILLTSCKKDVIEASEQYYAKGFVVMEQKSLQIVASRNEYYCQSVASISKIMTGILAIESGKLDETVVVGKEIDKAYGSRVYLKENDHVRLEELVYGLLLRSGNDCANSIAYYLSGSIEAFATIMNNKALELGMKYSMFVNPSGLDEIDGGNISCAYDMAKLMAYCLNNPIFRIISKTVDYKSNYGFWHNKNRLLGSYKYTTSGKTGYTLKARRTLITSAKKDETEFIVVTLNCGNDFEYHRYLYENYFDLYESKLILTKGYKYLDSYQFEVENDIYLLLKKEEWDKAQIIYELDENNLTLKVYLITTNSNLIATLPIELIEEEEENIFQIIIKFFKGLSS